MAPSRCRVCHQVTDPPERRKVQIKFILPVEQGVRESASTRHSRAKTCCRSCATDLYLELEKTIGK